MLRFLAFLLGLILGFNGSGSEPQTPDRGQNTESGPRTALVVPSVTPPGMPIGGTELLIQKTAMPARVDFRELKILRGNVVLDEQQTGKLWEHEIDMVESEIDPIVSIEALLELGDELFEAI